MIKEGLNGLDPLKDEDQMKIMLRALISQALTQDKLFEQTGVEEEQLIYSVQKLGLESEPEF